MKAIADNVRLQFDENQKPEIVISLLKNAELNTIQELKNSITNGKQLDVEIKVHRNRRSLDSNAYLWVLLEKLATALHTTKDELYLLILERYGVFTHMIVKEVAAERIMREWRTVRNLGPVTVGGTKGVQLQCYFGSSTYDTAEMSRLIDGVASECRELSIETLPDETIKSMSQDWGR